MILPLQQVRHAERTAFRELRRPKYMLRKYLYPKGEKRIDDRSDFYNPIGPKTYTDTGPPVRRKR